MNNKTKHIISTTMAIATFSMVETVIPFDFGITAAYASSYELTNLQMQPSGGGGEISIYENDNYTKELDNANSLKNTYYAKVSSDRSNVVFNTSGFDGIVKIVKDNSSKVYDEGKNISVLTGKTTFYIRLYDNDTYNEEKPADCKKEYRVIVKKYSSEEEQAINNDTQGNIYLKTIELDYGDTPLSFDKQKSTYDIKVGADVKSIPIKAEPDDGATTVKINNLTVDENDDYRKIVNLGTGDNKIEISLSQSDVEKRVYTLNINRSESSTATTGNTNVSTATTTNNTTGNNVENTNNSENNVSNTKSPNKWVKVSDKWKYNDSFGNAIKNTWFHDSNYGKNYYFNNDGNMITGWLNLNNTWYYLDINGAMQTGWKQIGSEWYYLNYDGKMQTGWFKDSDGKYYYLYESTGAMAHDTTIDGYKLGSNGVWKK